MSLEPLRPHLLLEAGGIHVVAVDFAPHVSVILRVVPDHVTEAGGHVGAGNGGNADDVVIRVREHPSG